MILLKEIKRERERRDVVRVLVRFRLYNDKKQKKYGTGLIRSNV